MSEDAKKDPKAPETPEVDYKERYESLVTATKEFPFAVKGENQKVALFAFDEKDGTPKPSEEAQRYLSGGKHVSQRLAEVNAEVKKQVEKQVAERLAAGGGKGTTPGGEPSGADANIDASVDAVLEANPELAEKYNDGDPNAQKEVLKRVVKQVAGGLSKQLKAELAEGLKGVKGVSEDDVAAIMAPAVEGQPAVCGAGRDYRAGQRSRGSRNPGQQVQGSQG